MSTLDFLINNNDLSHLKTNHFFYSRVECHGHKKCILIACLSLESSVMVDQTPWPRCRYTMCVYWVLQLACVSCLCTCWYSPWEWVINAEFHTIVLLKIFFYFLLKIRKNLSAYSRTKNIEYTKKWDSLSLNWIRYLEKTYAL